MTSERGDQAERVAGDDVGAALADALLEHLHAALESFRTAIADLGVEQLNWRPGPETNSLAVLVAHTVDTARSIVHDLVDDPIPRNRQAAFEVTDASEADLGRLIDTLEAELDALVRESFARPLDRPVARYRTASQAFWLFQLLGHTREHAAHASLTRQLVEAAFTRAD